MALNIKTLDEIYFRYGYEEKHIDKNVRVYILRQGMYYGAEVIPLVEDYDCNTIVEDLTNYGYMCKVRKYQSEKEAESKLFEGFFNTRFNLQKLKRKYDEFTTRLGENAGSTIKYKYINSPYNISQTGFDLKGDNIVDDVYKLIENRKPIFIIIEAAAGFGKTCTAYEILSKVVSNYKSRCPLFTELSRNRQARIFRYVLLSEIEEEFHGHVNTDLVIHHIKSGKIPLIIDGFDELLNKDHEKQLKHSEFEQVETMLSTIGDLLEGSAKIILTSRKTAVFSSDEFYKWVDSHSNRFEIVRFSIDEPKIGDWLDDERLSILEENRVPVRHVANPVLLSYLRYLKLGAYKKMISGNEGIVKKYFSSMLIREQERQNLKIDPSVQYNIFKDLAFLFAELNISSEERGFVKELILDYNQDLLSGVRMEYPASSRPSVDELADTLVNHALLDRHGSKGKNIGFINDFIFGLLLGENIIDNSRVTDLIEENMAELAVTAFQFQDTGKKNKLWDLLSGDSSSWSSQFKIVVDTKLKNFIYGNFDSQFFESMKFDGISFDTACSFIGCTFNETQFVNCIFTRSSFSENRFINCRFFSCSMDESCNTESENYFVNCIDSGKGFLASFNSEDEDNRSLSEFETIEKRVLEYFLRVDGKTSRVNQISSLLNEFQKTDVDQKTVMKLVHSLSVEGVLKIDGNNAFLTAEGNSYYGKKYR